MLAWNKKRIRRKRARQPNNIRRDNEFLENDVNTIDCSCGGIAQLTTGREIYPHRPDLFDFSFFKCGCGAYVGCHKGTRKPLGTPANEELRKLRMDCHHRFDKIWKDGKTPRSTAYTWLGKLLKLEKKQNHIAMFDVETCKKLLQILGE